MDAQLLTLAIFLISSVSQAPVPRNVQVPDGDGAWTIYVTTGGGFTGSGRGSATITSQGYWNCPQVIQPCANKLSEEKLGSLKSLIATFDLKQWSGENQRVLATSLCSDCYTTRVTFVRRESGKLEIFTLSWDDTSQGSAPREVVRLAEMALTQKW